MLLGERLLGWGLLLPPRLLWLWRCEGTAVCFVLVVLTLCGYPGGCSGTGLDGRLGDSRGQGRLEASAREKWILV